MLHTVAKSRKQPKRPSADEWIKKTWGTYTVEYYPAMKRGKQSLFAAMWMDPETVIVSEVSQEELDKPP